MNLSTVLTVAGRALIAMLFIFAGVAKALAPQPFLDHMAEFGVPAVLLPAVIVLEVGAGIALLAGRRLRYTAGALAVFCILTAIIFHHELGVKVERTQFLKDLAIAGALLVMSAADRRVVSRIEAGA